jgi:hypothetical protein
MELKMIGKLTLAAGLVALGTFAGSTFASAATVAPGMSLPTLSTDAVVEKTQWRGRCRAWRHECARRWGWGGMRFRSCLARHGCL